MGRARFTGSSRTAITDHAEVQVRWRRTRWSCQPISSSPVKVPVAPLAWRRRGHVTRRHQISPARGYVAGQRAACASRPPVRPRRRPCAVAAVPLAASTASPGLGTAQAGDGKKCYRVTVIGTQTPGQVTMSTSEDRTSDRPEQRSRRAGPRTTPGRSPAEGRAVTARRRSSPVLQEVQSYG
jgi:hypothetical protein